MPLLHWGTFAGTGFQTVNSKNSTSLFKKTHINQRRCSFSGLPNTGILAQKLIARDKNNTSHFPAVKKWSLKRKKKDKQCPRFFEMFFILLELLMRVHYPMFATNIVNEIFPIIHWNPDCQNKRSTLDQTTRFFPDPTRKSGSVQDD